MATRLAVSRWRRARRWLELVRRTPPADHAPGPGPERTALVAALRTLPEAQRMAIVLHHLCDLSIEQVASETGAPVGTVKARLSRGRTALARVLSEDPADLGLPARPSGFAKTSGKGEREDDRVR